MTQTELAQAIGGCSHVYINRVEEGQNKLPVGKLFDIARGLGVSVHDFFTPVDKEEITFIKSSRLDDVEMEGKIDNYAYKFLQDKDTNFPNSDIHPCFVKFEYMANHEFKIHQHRGTELIILRSGKLKIFFKNNFHDTEFYKQLDCPFDSLLFNGRIGHKYEALEEGTTAYCIVSDSLVTPTRARLLK